MQKWTQDEIRFLSQWDSNIKPVEVYKVYREEFGDNRSYDSVQKKFKSLLEDIDVTPIAESDSKSQEKLHSIETSDLDLLWAIVGRKNKTLTEKLNERTELNDWLHETVEESRNFSVGMNYSALPTGGNSFVILLSDNHFGKKTKIFDMAKARERIFSIPNKIKDLNLQIDEIVVVLAGDMVEGEDIYPTQASHLECPVLDQVKVATSTYFELGLRLREVFDVPVRFETCPGNHGRISKTANEKSNWDNCIYQNLGMLAEIHSDSEFRVNVNFDTFHVFPVQDKKALIFHHGTKHLGTPAMQKKHAGWAHTKDHDFMMHGHWHQWEIGTFLGIPVMKNGSLCGQDDLAERMGVFEPARQGWFLIKESEAVNHMGYFEWGCTPLEEGVGSAPSGWSSPADGLTGERK